ncbi:MAG TPA: hypothetical protein VF657_14915 [Actinoplanes sp.]|jgi:hypothetical protein
MGWFDRWRRGRHTRARQQAQAASEAAQEAERQAARQRLLDAARRNSGPAWDAPTRPLPQLNRALLTPGQAHRARRPNGGR